MSLMAGSIIIPVTDGAMVAAIRLDQLTTITVSNATTLVPLDNTKMGR